MTHTNGLFVAVNVTHMTHTNGLFEAVNVTHMAHTNGLFEAINVTHMTHTNGLFEAVNVTHMTHTNGLFEAVNVTHMAHTNGLFEAVNVIAGSIITAETVPLRVTTVGFFDVCEITNSHVNRFLIKKRFNELFIFIFLNHCNMFVGFVSNQ